MRERKVGRPSKLTPDVKRRLLDAIRAGNYYEAACRYAGISPSTFYRWMERGQRANSGQFREFWEAVTHAEAEAEVRMVTQWQAQIPHDWRAARDFLARRFPKRWAQQQSIDLLHSGEVTQRYEGDVTITERLLVDADFLAAIQRAAENGEAEDLTGGFARRMGARSHGGKAVGEAD